jgi:hypothetical protein
MDDKFTVYDYTKKKVIDDADVAPMEDLGNSKADPITADGGSPSKE